jgi:hypothetical protein
MDQPRPSLPSSEDVPAMSAKEAAVYATDLLLELRNITSAHPKLTFLTYLLEMAFQEAFNASARKVEDLKKFDSGRVKN